MWRLFQIHGKWNEIQYMSYTASLGSYHTKRIKRYIAELPELYGDYTDLTDSESLLYYGYDNKRFFCEPTGILTAMRGKHPDEVICDDILRDPEVKLDTIQLEKLAEKFFEVIEQMPKKALHLVGTPQDFDDLFAKVERLKSYNCERYDAEVCEGVAWWDGLWPWAKLQERKATIGVKAYNKEFRCHPVRGEEGYVSYEDYCRIARRHLKNYSFTRPPKFKTGRCVTAGLDIGKKTHPSHLSVLAEHNKRLVQVHSKFMDGWAYYDQIAYCREAIKAFGIDRLYYDNTRAEFEESSEKGELPGEMEGIAMTGKSNFMYATELDKLVTQGRVQLVTDDRQKRQILSVDCDLKAPSNSEGHGDSFFSLILAIGANREINSVRVWDLQ